MKPLTADIVAELAELRTWRCDGYAARLEAAAQDCGMTPDEIEAKIPPVSTLDFEPLERAAGVKFSQAQRIELLGEAWTYKALKEREGEPLAAQEIRKNLGAIGKHANALAEALDSEAGRTNFHIAFKWRSPGPLGLQRRFVRRSDGCPLSRSDVVEILRALAESARGYEYEGVSGRPRDKALHGLVYRVRKIWRDAGGKGVGCHWDEYKETVSGPLVELLEVMCRQVKVCAPSRHTLRRVIEEVAAEQGKN